MVDADRPEALSISGCWLRSAGIEAGEYRTALRIDPGFVPALVNLADLDRMLRRPGGDGTLKDNGVDWTMPMPLFSRSVAGGPARLCRGWNCCAGPMSWRRNARYAYVYAVALNSTGAPPK
jgi:hypothetical protein